VSANSEEPIRTFSRTAVTRATAIYANLPPLAREQLSIQSGDDLTVDVHCDRVVIYPGEDDG
jgi:hypothetical protein